MRGERETISFNQEGRLVIGKYISLKNNIGKKTENPRMLAVTEVGEMDASKTPMAKKEHIPKLSSTKISKKFPAT